MGMYTELVLCTSIKDDKEVIQILQYMGQDEWPEDFVKPDHKLFNLHRHQYMLRCCSYYFTPTTVFKLEQDDMTKEWCLVVRCDLKNYENEIESFVDWLSPYIADHYGQMIGYSRYEECDKPTILYAPGQIE